jgi:hypothetical protein
MVSDSGLLLGAEVAMPSQKHSKMKVVGGVVCAVAAGMMLGAAIGGFNKSNPAPVELAVTMPSLGGLRATTLGNSGSAWTANRPQFTAQAMSRRAAQDKMQTYGISSSPLSQFALTAIDVANRDNARDISVKAAGEEMVSGWNLVDPKVKKNLLRVLEEVENKESLLAGVTAPMNYFDPLGFATTVTAGKLLFYREVELKHGRVAMLASLGILVGENYHPLFGGNIDEPAIYAFQQTPLETFWYAVVAAIAILEAYSVFTFQDPLKKGSEQWAIKESHMPGDLGYDPLGLKPSDPKAFVEMQTKELNNGRLAMIGVAGMIAQELATGQKIFG